MTGDDLKEQLLSIANRIGERIQDLPLYTQIKDQFDSLSPAMQKLTVLIGVLSVFAVLLFLPWGWYSESQDLVDSFEDRRAVIRELLKVSRESSEVPDIPMPPPMDGLKAELQARLQNASLIEEQIAGIDVDASGSQLIPGDKSAGALAVRLTKLNLRQIVEIGTLLTQINPSVKMTDLEVTATKEDPHYFDVIYRITALAVPDLSAPPPEPETPAPRRRGGGDQ